VLGEFAVWMRVVEAWKMMLVSRSRKSRWCQILLQVDRMSGGDVPILLPECGVMLRDDMFGALECSEQWMDGWSRDALYQGGCK